MLKRIVLVLIALFVVAQLVPRTFFPISNPGVDETKTLQANAHKLTPQVDSILKRACYDCHSNKTFWPWYSKVAPVSWLLSHDVADGRREMNFSEWGTYPAKRVARKLEETCQQVERGEMPLSYYLPMHSAARLSDADRKAICAWTRDERTSMPPVPDADRAPAH